MKRLSIPPELEWRLLIRKPTGRRKSFKVIRRNTPPGRGEVTLSDKRIDSINHLLHSGKLSFDQCYERLEMLVETMYREAGVVYYRIVSTATNRDLLNRFWDEEYKHRRLRSPMAMYHDYRRAVECLGDVCLGSATEREIMTAISKRCGNDSVMQRRVTSRLSTLLKYCKREIKLTKDKIEPPEPQFLTEAEMRQVLPYLPDRAHRILVQMAFATGCRIGELFHLEQHHWRPSGEIEVVKQRYADGTTGPLKNRRPRRTLFLDDKELFDAWVDIKDSFPKRIRNTISKTFRTACRKAFDNPSKHMPFKDLRHSYAVHLSQAGVSVGLVANCLGNTEHVCETYYKSHKLTEETVRTVRMILEENKKNQSQPTE